MPIMYKVIYITGQGHSGSTLLDLIIGSHSDVVSVGEIKPKSLHYLDDAKSNKKCICGSRIRDCDFWNGVTSRLSHPAAAVCEKGNEKAKTAFVSAALAVSGCSVYCENTKSERRLRELADAPELDLFAVELVRDPRAVAFSYQRKRGGFLRQLIAFAPFSLAGLVQRRADCRRLTVRYEKFSTRPDRVVPEIMQFAGLRYEPAQLDYKAHVHHNLDGNKMRKRPARPIAFDDHFLNELTGLQWIVSTILLAPAVLYHKYPLSRKNYRERQLA
jgi:hypothetical protein